MLRINKQDKQAWNNRWRNPKTEAKQTICEQWPNQNNCAGCNADVPSPVKKS